MNRRIVFHALIVMGALLLALPAFAGKGGNGNGNSPSVTAAPSCTVDGTVVSATGLPTGEVVNFMLTNASGTTGWVLGYTSDGVWSTNVPAASGPTTYEFVSRTSGKGGENYTVFAGCSA